MKLDGLNVLITGATGGIGEQLTVQFSRAGATVTALGRNPDRLASLGGLERVLPVAADLGTPQGRTTAMERVLDNGPIDVLINNAGVQTQVNALKPPSWETLEQELQINLHAPIHLIHLVLPALMARTPERPNAAVVNITSGLALAPKASAAPYCAAKAGLRTYSMALRHQLAGTPVRVVEVLPPIVRTPMTEGRNTGAMDPEDCAAHILRDLARGKQEIPIGKTRLLKILTRIAPTLAEQMMLKY